MRAKIYLLILFLCTYNAIAQFDFQRNWGTYLGDERFELGDSNVDSAGNLYIVGTVAGSDLTNILSFTNDNSHQQTYGGGSSDGFIIKLNPNGGIVWGTYFGGEDMDRITAITFDNNDNLYILGVTASNTNIATTGSFQQSFGGFRDAFLAKLDSNGIVVWSTYYGKDNGEGSESPIILSSITFDGNNSIYALFQAQSNELATAGAFQTIPIPETIENNNASPSMIAKFDLDGNRLWATYYGIFSLFSVKADAYNVYVTGFTQDCLPNGAYNTYYGTSNAFMSEPASCRDIILTQFSSTGERLWSTYYGGSSNGDAVVGKRAIDLRDNTIFLAGRAVNYTNQEIATAGTYQPFADGAPPFVAQFNADGTRNWGTYNGLSADGLADGGPTTNVLSEQGSTASFYNYGATQYSDNIATPNSYQVEKNAGSKDAFVCKFENQLVKEWGTYYGGEGEERNANFHPYDDGTKFYIVGETQSLTQIASANGLQPTKQVFDTENGNMELSYTLFIAHFEPKSLSVDEVNTKDSYSLFPNPNSGTFKVKFINSFYDSSNLEVFDVLGKKIHSQLLTEVQSTIDTQITEKGVYFVKITNRYESVIKKIIIN